MKNFRPRVVVQLAFVALVFVVTSAHAGPDTCVCPDPKDCRPLSGVNPNRTEVYVFSSGLRENWQHYRWELLTTVAVFDTSPRARESAVSSSSAAAVHVDPELVCEAHRRGVRVTTLVDFPKAQLGNHSYETAWLAAALDSATAQGLDGINIDFEQPLTDPSTAKQLTALVEKAQSAFHHRNPASHVTFDVAWSPNCIDKRCYDYAGLGRATDFLFVMAYDLRSQVRAPLPCVAGANSGLAGVEQGVQAYLEKGISANHLVLGLPWYGFDYTCLTRSHTMREQTEPSPCYIKHVPFRGVNCSDAAGVPSSIAQVENLIQTHAAKVHWDNSYETPYFEYYSQSGERHQVWYDDPRSLSKKVEFAKRMGLRGVGCWEADYLNYGDAKMVSGYWDAFALFTSGEGRSR